MSGIGPAELIVLVVVGLLILGPERLPRVATQIGRWVGRARRTANQLRYQLEREITLADIEGKKKKDQDKKNDDTPGESEDSGKAAGESEASPSDTVDSAVPDSNPNSEHHKNPNEGADPDSNNEPRNS